MTLEQIIESLRIAFPTLTESINGKDVTLSPEAYEERIAEMATYELARQEQESAIAAQKQLAKDVQTALTLLDGSATLAQMRTILARLIRYLIAQGVIDIERPTSS